MKLSAAILALGTLAIGALASPAQLGDSPMDMTRKENQDKFLPTYRSDVKCKRPLALPWNEKPENTCPGECDDLLVVGKILKKGQEEYSYECSESYCSTWGGKCVCACNQDA